MNGHDHLDPDDVPDDALDDEPRGDPGDDLGDRLRLLLGPSDGLDSRTTRDVDSALRARSPLAAAFELFGVGWWTVETLFTDRALADQPATDGPATGDPLTDDPAGPLTGRARGADGDVEGP